MGHHLGDRGQRNYGEVLELPELPVLALDPQQRSGTRKLSSVAAFAAANRPLAWVDDELYDDARSWCDLRDAATLLLRTTPSVGLQRAEIDVLKRFGEAL